LEAEEIFARFFLWRFELPFSRNAQKRDKKNRTKQPREKKKTEEKKAAFFVMSRDGLFRKKAFFSCFKKVVFSCF
jgi:hypothetical protein